MSRTPLLFCAVLAGVVMAPPATARDCSPPEGPPGVRMPERVGCKGPWKGKQGSKLDPVRAGRAPGFIDLGNGAQIRIGGEVEAEGQFRRQRR